MDTITELMENVTLREELPMSYTGKMQTEFETVVALLEMACTFKAADYAEKAEKVHNMVHKFVSLVNKVHFAMRGEKAPRLSEEDIELAQAHAVTNLPMEMSHDQFIVDDETLQKSVRATSNICTDCVEYILFEVSEFRDRHKKAKEQCKRAVKCAVRLQTLVKSVTDKLDRDTETTHMFVNKDSVKYADMTTHERRLKDRKNRGTSRIR